MDTKSDESPGRVRAPLSIPHVSPRRAILEHAREAADAIMRLPESDVCIRLPPRWWWTTSDGTLHIVPEWRSGGTITACEMPLEGTSWTPLPPGAMFPRDDACRDCMRTKMAAMDFVSFAMRTMPLDASWGALA